MPVSRVLTRPAGPTSDIGQSEKAIERQVRDGDKEKESAPGGADQVGVGQKSMQPPASFLHIEAAVPIEQAKLTLLRDDPAESQIAGWIFGSPWGVLAFSSCSVTGLFSGTYFFRAA